MKIRALMSSKKILMSRKLIIRSFSTSLFKFCAHTNGKLSYIHNIGKDPLVYRNVGQQLDLAVKKYGNREAIVSCHEGKRFTFIELQNEVNKLAAGFIEIGLQKGDRIGLWAPNNINWYFGMLAAAKAGLVSVGINPALQAREVEYCINKVGCKAILTSESFKTQNYYKILQDVAPEIKNSIPGRIQAKKIPSLKSIIIDSKTHFSGTYQYNEMFSLASEENVQKINSLQYEIDPDSPCNIQFTSGTTGNPKAAILSHYNFVNNSIHIGNRNELNTQHHRICVQNPLFHAFGVVITIMAGLSHGATLVLPSAGFSPEKSLKAIINEKCTVIHGTPTMYVDLVSKQRELNLNIESAEIAITGGAICSPKLFKDIKDILNLKKVKTVFGMTETTAVIFQSLLDESEELVQNTVGYIQDHTEAKVIDSNGRVVPFGHPGELCVRGYFTMLGYFGDEEKTKETIGNDKWLKTGDQFILEENGYGKIVGRLKDMIIRGGENIFPKEIENYLETHPDIIEAQVIGVPDKRMGEELCAFIRLREGVSNLTQEDVRAFAKGNIAHFKIPKYVFNVDNFPKTMSGKIQKFKLKETFEKHMESTFEENYEKCRT